MNNLRVYDLGANLLGLLCGVYLYRLSTHVMLLYICMHSDGLFQDSSDLCSDEWNATCF